MIDVATPASDTLSPTEVDDGVAADFFQVLSSPIRLGVLRLLMHGERCVSDLAEELGIVQPRLSNHLACLRTCGFVSVRRQGTHLYYALADERLTDLLHLSDAIALPSTEAFRACSLLRQDEFNRKGES